jgi:hypothetical protein
MGNTQCTQRGGAQKRMTTVELHDDLSPDLKLDIIHCVAASCPPSSTTGHVQPLVEC